MHDVTVTQCNLNPALGSILRRAPIPPSKKVQIAAMLRGQTLGGFARDLGRTRQHLYEVLSGGRVSNSLTKEIAGALGVAVEDIFSPSRSGGEQAAA